MPRRRKTHAERVVELLRRQSVVRPRELEARGISRVALQRLMEAGRVERIARGLYRLAGQKAPPHAGLVEVARRVPKAVIGLLSALAFHGIGTQLPHRVWILIPTKAWAPRQEHPPLEVVRCDPKGLVRGVEVHAIDGIKVRITSPARTVADCFKYRSRVGLDVALEALREGWRDRRFSAGELLAAARAARVERVLRPYLEALA
jgi:predicted transcriptional regulator of viral defense system